MASVPFSRTALTCLAASLFSIWSQSIISQARAQNVNLQQEYIMVGRLADAGRYEEAVQRGTRLLRSTEQQVGPDHLMVSDILFTLGRTKLFLSTLDEAESDFRRASLIRERHLGSDHPLTADVFEALGSVLLDRGSLAESEKMHRRAMTIRRAAFGEMHATIANSLTNLANVAWRAGRLTEADAGLRQALVILERTKNTNNANYASLLNNVGVVNKDLGKFSDARSFLERSLALRERTLGQTHPMVAETLNNLGNVYFEMSSLREAERTQSRALAIKERILPSGHPGIALTLLNLAAVILQASRPDEAEALLQRALTIRQKATGPESSDIAQVLGALALVKDHLKEHAAAEKLYRQAIPIYERTLGPEHPETLLAMGNFAVNHEKSGRLTDAEALFRRVLSVRQRTLGTNHYSIGIILNQLGHVYLRMNRPIDARPLLRQALAIGEQVYGNDAIEINDHLALLAQTYLDKNDMPEALALSERAIRILMLSNKAEASGRMRYDATSRSDSFLDHVAILRRATDAGVASRDAMTRAFEYSQRAVQSNAAVALNQMAARVAAGSGALANTVREQQDAYDDLAALEKSRISIFAKGDDKARSEIIARTAERETQVQRLDRRIKTQFPQYANLVEPRPLSLQEVQHQLSDSEALLFFVVSEKGNFVFAINKETASWKELIISRAALAQKVKELRSSVEIDPGKTTLPPFNAAVAFELYDNLIAPIREIVKGRQRLIVVGAGALTSIPIHVLLTEPPPAASPAPAYAHLAWLARKHSVSILPSVTALKTLPQLSGRGLAPLRYIGFGDPIFSTSPGGPDGQSRSSIRPRLTSRGYLRTGRSNLDALNGVLPPLPETADEIREVAGLLGAADSQINLRENATERAVKAAALDRYRIVHFATHALLPEETADVHDRAEPALALTLPKVASDADDALLTASEVAQLRLNADWVILSACNTASGDKPGAEALSGLARAFFYAGAKSLLVSHWPVESKAAVKLITRTVQNLESNKEILPAEGLRQAMLALIDDKSSPHNSHPAIWAPFVNVGY